jgi:hypothetical protein
MASTARRVSCRCKAPRENRLQNESRRDSTFMMVSSHAVAVSPIKPSSGEPRRNGARTGASGTPANVGILC